MEIFFVIVSEGYFSNLDASSGSWPIECGFMASGGFLVSKLVLMGRMDSFWFEPRGFVVNKIRFNIDDTITEEVVMGRRI